MDIQIPSYNQTVRVAVNNNFNCTPKEWEQLDLFSKMYPQKYFFINSNIKTPLLSTINDHDYKAVITINPDLTINPDQVDRLYTVEPSKIGFLRVKWLPVHPEIETLIEKLLHEEYAIVITVQRWNNKTHLEPYTSLEYYHNDCSKWRLHGEALQYLHTYVDDLTSKGFPIYICDRNDLGCGGCKLCSLKTIGKPFDVYSLNLSSSGICPHSCPDCYAKTMQHMLRCFGRNPIRYDSIRKNHKQAGRTKHIKKAKAS